MKINVLLYFNNSTLSSSLFSKSEQKNYKYVNGFKTQTLINKLKKKKKILSKNSKILLRINCEGVEDDVIKIFYKFQHKIQFNFRFIK